METNSSKVNVWKLPPTNLPGRPLLGALVLALVLGGLSLPQQADAKRLRFHKQKQHKITGSELAMRISRKRPYSENWSLWAMSGGWNIYASLFVTRMHPMVGTRAGVQLTLISPTGKVHHELAEYKKHKLAANKKRLYLRAHRTIIRSDGNTGILKIKLKKLSLNVRFKRQLKGFRFQGGTIRAGRRKFIGLTFIPRASIQGSFHIKGRTFPIKGIGYLDRSWQNEPHKIARLWYNARAFSKDYTVLVSHFVPLKGWYPKKITGLSVAYKGKWIFHGHWKELKLSLRRRVKDDGSGYKVPKRVTIKGKSKEGWSVDLALNHTRRTQRLDVLAHVPGILRFFIQKWITNPYIFRHRGKLKLRLKHKGKIIALKLPVLTESVFLNR